MNTSIAQKTLIVFLILTAHISLGQINFDSLLTLSKSREKGSAKLLKEMVYKNSTVEIKKGAQGFALGNSAINIFESKESMVVPLLRTEPSEMFTLIDGKELIIKSKDYVNNSFSSPLIDSIAIFGINKSEQIKIDGINLVNLDEILRLQISYFKISVKTDTAFKSKTRVDIKKADFTFQGVEGEYYKFLIPSLINQTVYAEKVFLDARISVIYKDFVYRFTPSDIAFMVKEKVKRPNSKGQIVSTFRSGNYYSVTRKKGSSYITTTNHGGTISTSTYTVYY